MVRPDGLVKVLDFGLAKLTEGQPFASALTAQTLVDGAPGSEELQTRAGLVMGTVHYMSSEQARTQAVDGHFQPGRKALRDGGC